MGATSYEAFLAKRNAPAEAASDVAPKAGTEPSSGEAARQGTIVPVTSGHAPRSESLLATRLEEVTEKAVNKLGDIIDMPLDPTDPHFTSVLRAQTSAANTTLTTQVKVDETTLRRQQLDRLPALLALVNATAARLPPMIEHKTDRSDESDNGP
jgi:hypothetical protein